MKCREDGNWGEGPIPQKAVSVRVIHYGTAGDIPGWDMFVPEGW